MLLGCPHELASHMCSWLHKFLSLHIHILSSFLFLWFGGHDWLWSFSENEFFEHDKQVFKKKLYQFLKHILFQQTFPPHTHTSFFSIPSTNIFSLTCFRLSRKSWTGVINIPVSRNNHCIWENDESSVLRTVTKWLRGLRFPLHTWEVMCVTDVFQKHLESCKYE